MQGQPGAGEEDFEWTVQHARSIAQTARFLATDFTDKPSVNAAEVYRDQLMADNITWWHQHTGHRILLSAHDGHVGLVTDDPVMYAKVQGTFLREALGKDYFAIETTFGQGSFLSTSQGLGGTWKKFTVGAPAPDSNEYTLDQVCHTDFFLDTRNAPPAARAWLNTARPTRHIGTEYPCDLDTIPLGPSCDVLIHLHRVREADLLR